MKMVVEIRSSEKETDDNQQICKKEFLFGSFAKHIPCMLCFIVYLSSSPQSKILESEMSRLCMEEAQESPPPSQLFCLLKPTT